MTICYCATGQRVVTGRKTNFKTREKLAKPDYIENTHKVLTYIKNI